VLDAGDQVSWISDAGNLRVEFDVNRCLFVECVSGTCGDAAAERSAASGIKDGAYKYRVWLNDQMVGRAK